MSYWHNALGGQQSNSALPLQPGVSTLPNTTTTMLPGTGLGLPSPIPDSAHPSPLPVGGIQSSTLSQLPSLENAALTPLSGSGFPTVGIHSSPNTLVGITAGPSWMQKKGTLKYFHAMFKLSHLPNVINHWYELERLLGFPDAISIL